jgi:hypothetical protein
MEIKLPPSTQKLLLFSLFWGISMGFVTIIMFYPELAKLTLIGGTFIVLCVAFWQLAEVTINDRNKLGK